MYIILFMANLFGLFVTVIAIEGYYLNFQEIVKLLPFE